MGGLTVQPMTRNTLMAATAVLALALLVTAAVGSYRAFSYLSAALILAVFASAATERADRELDLGPYTSLVAGLGVLFVAGLTGIWLLWNPSVTEYTYVLGLPQSTLVYAVCLWLLPLLGAVYYATSIFPETASDDVVEGVIDEAREAQASEAFPLSPNRPTQTEADGGADQ